MDAFVDKVKAAPARMRVVSLRSVDAVDVLRLRSTLRYLQRQRDEQVRALGTETLRLFEQGSAQPTPPQVRQPAASDLPLERGPLKLRVEAIRAIDRQTAELEARLQSADQAARISALARPSAPFLTVCACGAPLFPEDVRCTVCGRDTNTLIQLAAQSKARAVAASCQCRMPLVAGIKFCPECGRSVVDVLRAHGLASGETLTCEKCGEGGTPGDQFCSSCGSALNPGG
ncbi:MAG: zinc ribbon domain-containing protein [Armatimonadetes bacterium]|nr:zinc ribbon domain-containing protein [Armatimonadota bacterium]